MPPKLLFLTLRIFSATGGIEKVCRVLGKALQEVCTENGLSLQVFSMYDKAQDADERYFPGAIFKGFNQNKVQFTLQSISSGRGAAVVVISHINLLPVAFTIKKLSPATKIVLLAHGIEVWRPLPSWKKSLLQTCDLILTVSRYTKQKMVELHGLDGKKLQVLNNCLDPFLPPPSTVATGLSLRAQHSIDPTAKVLLTVCRLSATEKQKGYDKVILALRSLRRTFPSIKYVLVGKYSEDEKARLNNLIQTEGVEDHVTFTGFVPDEQLPAYYQVADVFIMPSQKEGFGIVFIEALYYGLPVIAGNRDGSVDALDNGRLGLLVDPESLEKIADSIIAVLNDTSKTPVPVQEVASKFAFALYKQKLLKILFHQRSVLPAA